MTKIIETDEIWNFDLNELFKVMPIGTRLFCSKPPLESVLQPISRGTSAVYSATGSKLTEIKTGNMTVTATDAGIISKRYEMVLFFKLFMYFVCYY
jgi:hypothetical protein